MHIFHCRRYDINRGVALLALSVLLVLPKTCRADSEHYKNLLVGERAAGMAGAYSAVSDSPEGAFYNPAGLIYSVGRSLSVSVNAFHTTETKYKGVLGGDDWTRTSSSLVPNFFGIVQTFGKGKLAFSYAVPDIVEEDQNQRMENINGNESYTYNLSNLDKTYKIGPSYARRMTDSLSVGGTLYFHYRQQKMVLNQFLLKSSALDEYEWKNVNYKRTEYGVDPKIGLMWSPMDKFTFGLSVSKGSVFSSDSRSQIMSKSTLPTAVPADNRDDPGVETSGDKRKYPLMVTAGGAWFPSPSLLVSVDIDYAGKISSDDPSECRESVVNVAVGTEYYLSDLYALRGGVYTNFSNTPELKAGMTDQEDHVDIYGFTTSISRFTRSSAMTLGLNYAYGTGAGQPFGGITNSYDIVVSRLTLYLSGSFNY